MVDSNSIVVAVAEQEPMILGVGAGLAAVAAVAYIELAAAVGHLDLAAEDAEAKGYRLETARQRNLETMFGPMM